MKQGFKKILSSSYLPIVLYALVLIVLHIKISIDYGDDLYYATVLDKQSLRDFISYRYFNWSSRIVIDVVTVFVARVPLLWKIIDVGVMVWIAAALGLFFNPQKKTLVSWGIVLLLLAFPFESMGTAGWIATTLNYSWCLGAGFLALVPIRNTLLQKATPKWLYALAVLAFIYASNQEQMCAVLLAVCGGITLYLTIKNKKLPCFASVLTLLGLVSMVFIMTCPGNSERLGNEVQNWFVEFENLSFFNKCELGFSRAMYEFLMKPNRVFTLFSLILFLAVMLCNKKLVYKITAAIPLATGVVFGEFGAFFEKASPVVANIRNALTKTGTQFNLSAPKTMIPVLLVAAVAVLVALSLYAVFGKDVKSLFSVYLLAVGLASAWVMGFSPTVWASEERTFIFMYISFIAVGGMLLNFVIKTPEKLKN